MKRAYRHGTTDPEFKECIGKFLMAYELGVSPKETEELPAKEVETYLELISIAVDDKEMSSRQMDREFKRW